MSSKSSTKTTDLKSDSGTGKKGQKMTVEDMYKKKSHHEHILSIPDTYIGTVQPDEKAMYIFDEERQMIIEEVIEYIAGFFKIFDEIIINARDHTVRDKTCKNIKINFNRTTGKISVWNDGDGIPVCMHDEHMIYIPELIFAHLLTSSNYEKKGKTVGGKNGYGAKLTNIYSQEFVLETVGKDKNGKKMEYKQIFKRNMYDVEKPVINSVDSSTPTYTRVTYLPDYARFGMNKLTDDMYRLLTKRCYDIAACTVGSVKVWLNDKEIKCRDFKDYINMYYDKKPNLVHEKINNRWEIGCVFSPDNGDRQISFVNGILTYQGGTHVQHVVENVVKKVTLYIKSIPKHKDLKIQPASIKQHLTFFINCVIEDPVFNSQVKEFMSSKMSDWCKCGNDCEVRCEIPDKFIKDLCDTGLLKEVVELSEFKEMKELSKTDGKKIGSLKGVDKLIDAECAGKRNSSEATLILTEGDSARAFAVSGLSVIGNKFYGVFPLKGKPLNVRNASTKQLRDNMEFSNLKLILGLKQGMRYKDTKKLRYGKVLILTDQDPDGSHIKGLVINIFEHFWPSLLQIDGFIRTINTPIIKAWKKTDKRKAEQKIFFTISDFNNWVKDTLKGDFSKWESKYYKGLGTSTEKEAKESFVDFDERLIQFIWEKPEQNENNLENDELSGGESVKSITVKTVKTVNPVIVKSVKKKESVEEDEVTENEEEDEEEDRYDESYLLSKSHKAFIKAFDTKKANDRREWLKKSSKNDLIEYRGNMKIPYSDFINKDMVHFSNLDNERSIPSMLDGLKPSQRKIIFASFKRGRKSAEVKVAQLSGYVSEHADYHHGEESLQGAIISMAQNFPGSNNINLLKPNGNFGYRRLGGKEHASARYIFTQIAPLTNKIFREEDDCVLCHNYADNEQIEPVNYIPIIPMVLANGATGIGTGWSSDIPPHNPRDIVMNLKRMLNDERPLEMIPWYQGFNGTVEKVVDKNGNYKNGSYIIKGVYSIDGRHVHITDIPIVDGWIEKYENKLKKEVSISKDDNLKIEQLMTPPNNNKIDITIIFKGQELQKMFKTDGELDKFLGMNKNLTVSNLVLFDRRNRLTKYDCVEDILHDFYDVRLEMYVNRKKYYLAKLKNDMDIYKYKAQFIREYLEGILLINRKKVAEVIDQLEKRNYPKLAHDHLADESKKSYHYMTDMSILTLTDDKIKELEAKAKECEMEYKVYFETTPKKIWENELDEFLAEYENHLIEWDIENDEAHGEKKKAGKKKGNVRSSDSNKSNNIKNVTKPVIGKVRKLIKND